MSSASKVIWSKVFVAYANCLMDDLEGPGSDSDIDPGKRTVWGWSAKRRESLGLPDNMTRAQAIQALFDYYWVPLGCDSMLPIVAWLYCDVKFNHGTKSSNMVLQSAVGAAADGRWGPRSKLAFKNWRSQKYVQDFVADYMSERNLRYQVRTRHLLDVVYRDDPKKHNKIWRQLYGWSNRLIKLEKRLYEAGFIKQPMSAAKVNATTAAGAAVGAAPVAAIVVAEAVANPTGSPIGQAIIEAASSVHPLVGAVLPWASALVARKWAKWRGR